MPRGRKLAAVQTVKFKRAKRRTRQGREYQSSMIIAPASAGAIQRSRVPLVRGMQESIMVSNTERLAVVSTVAAGAEQITRIDICPASCAWLSGVGINYSKFKWKKLELYYIPSCGTQNAGVMAMGLTYDNGDSLALATVAQVQQLNRGVSAPVWAGYEGSAGLNTAGSYVPPGSVHIEVDCDKFDHKYYKYATTAQIAAMTAVDTATYVPVSLVIGTGQGNAFVGIGNVLIKYQVELLEPIPAGLND